MEPLNLSNEILLEDILDTNEYVHSEKRNLLKKTGKRSQKKIF